MCASCARHCRASSLPDGVHIASALDDAISLCSRLVQHGRVETLFAIGGSQVYAEALNMACTTKVFLTSVETGAVCDTFIPDFTKDRFVLEDSSDTREENGIKYHFETYSALKPVEKRPAVGPLNSGVASLSRLVRVQWSASRGKAVFATHDIEAGEILWREHPVAAMQYAESRQSGMLACRDSLRFVGTLESQLQVLGHFTESEQAAGAANIEPALIELMSQSKAAERCSGSFALQVGDHGGEEIFADSNARDRAFEAYNRWLSGDPAAWLAFQEHALGTNETFILAAQLLARYFCSGGDGKAESCDTSQTTVPHSRRAAEVLEGLISTLWWDLPSASIGAAESGQQSGQQSDREYKDEEASVMDVATSRRVLLQESYEHLAPITRAAGAEVTIEMYSRLIGALELNSIAVEIQSPLAAFLQELLEHQDDAKSASIRASSAMSSSSGDTAVVNKGRVSEGSGAEAATTATGLREQDVERAVSLILPHVERRLDMVLAADSHEHSSDDPEMTTKSTESLTQAVREPHPKSSIDATASDAVPALKRQRLEEMPSDASATSQPATTVPPTVRLREVIDMLGSVDQLYPPLCGVGLYDGVAMLNHDCEPNAVVVFEQDAMATVAALRSIRKGDEICISYIDVDQNADERRADLLDYGFVCSCRRCSEEAGLETERTH
eukprot:COSAG02_NODE_527_length_20704_cov_120.745462_9_plen_674_part_00